MKYIPSETIRIPLKVFSRVAPDGMIRLPTSDEEAAHIGETFPDDDTSNDHAAADQTEFHDEDDDIPPPVAAVKNRKVATTENEEDVFDVVSDDDDDLPEGGESDWNKAWRD